MADTETSPEVVVRCAEIAVTVPGLDRLTYRVPTSLHGLQVGHAVRVPIGGREEIGYVVDAHVAAPKGVSLRDVIAVVEADPVFDAAQQAFFEWIAGYYLQPLGRVIQMAVPSNITGRVIRGLCHTEEGVEALARGEVSGHAVTVLRQIIRRTGYTRRGLARSLQEELEPDEVKQGTRNLVQKGWASWVDRWIGTKRPTEQVVARKDGATVTGRRMGALMRSVWEHLAGGELPVRDLVAAEGAGARGSIKRLIAAGLVISEERPARDLLNDASPAVVDHAPELNADQTAALDALKDDDALPAPHLLFGVTGSGKTEVFMGVAQKALTEGKQVLVLVPEIGLTPQLVGRFRARFREPIAVLHSGLTGSARRGYWDAIRAGDARIVVGARSAIFAPFQQLGLVVVDEEHDDSYKQSEGVPYHGRDLAVLLARQHGCHAVLASATPSLESWVNAASGRYRRLDLPRRATPRPVPMVEVIDRSTIPRGEGQAPLLASEVVEALNRTFADGGQAIVLYNRRGFATMVECTSCGATYECPNCGVTMTLHKKMGRVVCHYCGLKRRYGDTCPVCTKEGTFQEMGQGTERIAERLAQMFTGVAVDRLDADVTAARGSVERVLSAFRAGETQLLVGTQLVAKGHDFPGVRTAVVVSADQGLRMPDFRSAERTYALLVQLAGRAGRGEHPGRVFVQTYHPEHYVFEHLHDAEGFYAKECGLRQRMGYPPSSRLCLLGLESAHRGQSSQQAYAVARVLREACRGAEGVSILGPAMAALPRLAGRWRQQVILRGSSPRAIHETLRRAMPRLQEIGRIRGVRLRWDVDPRHLM